MVLWVMAADALAGLMVEHPLVRGHVVSIDGTLEGVMGLSKESFMRVLLKTVCDANLSQLQ
jgi:hypothetical protein